MRATDAAPADLVLRPAEPADLGEIGELFWAARAAAAPAMPSPVHPRADVLAFYAAIDLADGREVWVAEDAATATLLGFAGMRREWLDDLYVLPAAQGRGVGSALLDLVKGLRPDGFGLWVFASNAPARAFYARHGLVEHETTDGSGNEERAPDVRLEWPGR